MTQKTFVATALLCSCLFAQSAEISFFSTNATWRWLRGTTEASSPDLGAWRSNSFNDVTFADAPAPFSYGEGIPNGTVLADMLNSYSCIFLRQQFVVTNAAELSALRFGAKVDDGYVVWINGNERLRVNVAGAAGDPVTITTLAANATEPVPFDFYTFASLGSYLVNGTNTIAIQVFNTSLGSSDLVFDCSLDGILIDTNPPVILSVTPPPGSTMNTLTQIVVQFSEPVANLSADDLYVSGVGALGLSALGSTYTFTFPQPPAGSVPITWVAGHGITDQATPGNPFNEFAPGATWSYTLVDDVPPVVATLFPGAGATVQTLGQIEVTFSETVVGVNAADLLVNGSPATNVVALLNSVYLFQFAAAPTGAVSVAWAGGHGITDVAAVPNAFAGGAWNYTVDPEANVSGVIINEINVSNQSGARDEDGEEHDWIELYNAGSGAVNLAGWSLSDEEDEPGRWVFPTRTLLPGEYMVVWASAKDRRAPTGTNRFHTNFKLAGDGEFLGLFTPDSPRQLASGFSPEFPEQRNDNSYGRDADGNYRYFGAPTFNATNGVSTITGVVSRVHFSAQRGHFTQPFPLALSCPTRGATIRYTLDGSEPTASKGFLYTGPINVNNSLFIRAGAFHENQLSSGIESHSFLYNQSAAIRSLPVLSIQTATNNLIGTNGIIGMQGGTGPPNNPWVAVNPGDFNNPTKKGIAWEKPNSVEYILPGDNSGFQIDCGIRVQGSDWTRPRYQASDKFSYRLYFRGDYSPGDLDYQWFTDSVVQQFDQIVLRAGHNDISNPFLRDELARQLHADMGQVAVHGNWVNFFLNGSYKGYYNPCERVEEGFLQQWHGGSNSWDVITVGSVSQGDGDTVDWTSLRNYINTQDATQPAVFNEVLRRMDVANFIDYLLVNTYAATWDWPHNNWRAARERVPTGKWRFYVWDAEGAFGEFDGNNANSDSFINRSINAAGVTSPLLNGAEPIPQFYTRLRNSAEFRLMWADRVQKHYFNGGAMTDTNITQRYLQMRGELSQVIPGFNNNILNNFIPQRRAVVFGQFNTYGLYASNAPVFNQHGSNVASGFALTMTASNGGTIYYTTDGVDPRVMYSGVVSASAVAYAGPVTLNQSVLVKARTLNGGNWSALTEANFAVGSRGVPLRITEISYNPFGGSAFEFIELQNTGTSPVDLSGMIFDGVTYSFANGASLAAGARLVIASDVSPGSFAIAYPGVTVAGYFSGNLNNAGERIALLDTYGNVITSVDFDDEFGWPTAADGTGYTLENINPYGDPDDPANWRVSMAVLGTPGAANAPALTAAVRLNETLAENAGAVNHAGTFPDYVELANTSGGSVDVSGWSLTDDGNARKFVFPPGTVIGANGFFTVWCDAATNATPGLHTDFALGLSGDSLYLYDAGTNLVDALSFGRQLPGYSVGRIGGAWVLNTPTTNAANVAAPVSPGSSLSINEFLANAPSGLPDWIELYNNSALPVALRGTFLSNTQTVHQITSLSFIPAFGYMQLFADEGVGPDHLDFKLSALGGTIILYDAGGTEVNRLSYTAQAEGVTRGRLPDGTATIVNFIGTASPGAANYASTYTGPVLNEVLARNASALTNSAGNAADYVELFNAGGSPFSLAGFSLGVDSATPGQWTFPPGASIAAGSYLVIWCDNARVASTNSGDYNTGRALSGESGGVYLFNTSSQLVNFVEFGFQVENRALGLVSSQWRLLTTNSPGVANGTAAALGVATALRFNEWMAASADGPDWFEIYNPTNLPVDLSNMVLTDDPTSSGTNDFRVPALSFIGAGGFVQFLADGLPEEGRNHVSFQLNALGDTLRLYLANGTNVVDTVVFGAQALGVSQGRVPDGVTNSVATFPGSASPAASNYRLIPGVVINEVLSHATLPLEPMIELHNVTGDALNIGGWFLSDGTDNLKKLRLADGTSIAPGGFITVSGPIFGTPPNTFTLDRARGGELWLSEAGADTNLTGFRTRVSFGAADNNVSFGRYPVAGRSDFVAQSAVTHGSVNAGPLVGPVVIHEIMYNPVDLDVGAREFIELRNISGAAVDLFDSALPANTWRVADGVAFTFPPGVTLAAGGYALLVDFDPVANPILLAQFRAFYSVSPAVPVFGPYVGQLNSAGDTIELRKPSLPDGAFLPYVLVDKVGYRDHAPWPSGLVDGGGHSLQRRVAGNYGNDPANWLAAAPTAGGANASSPVAPPVITQSPVNANVFLDSDVLLQAAATGPGPILWQWRFNGVELPGATNAALFLESIRSEESGLYDVFAYNAGGAVFSAPAQLNIVQPVFIAVPPPANYATNGGSNVTFNVTVGGTPPFGYQWRFNGADIPGANASTFSLTNLVLSQSAVYSVAVTNNYGAATASVTLVVMIRPVITNHIQPQTVLQGGTATFSLVAGPDHPLAPLWYRWIRNGSGFATTSVPVIVITNVQASATIRVGVTNAAAPAGVFSPVSGSVALTVLPDVDGDGISDWWETNYFGIINTTNNAANALLDPDGDGMNNRDEYVAGTNPTNALSLLRLELIPTVGLLEFVAQSNIAYTIQYRTNFGAASWSSVTNIASQPSNRTIQLNAPNPLPEAERYYRVVTPPLP
jgi:hypothetical protein